MKSPRAPLTALPLLCVTLAAVATLTAEPARDYPTRVATVTNTPGCVAFSDNVSPPERIVSPPTCRPARPTTSPSMPKSQRGHE